MTYDEALQVLAQKRSKGIKLGTERVRALLNNMRKPQDKMKIIHIAGTNGKGTVAKTINDALVQRGYKVGIFTSPWIFDYREQIQLNNQFIPENIFVFYVNMFKDFDCTEFELLTIIMYRYFSDAGVDYAVIECGMGGENDATNVEEKSLLSIITSISLDHTEYFGSTIEQIAREKGGILRKNSKAFIVRNKAADDIFSSMCDDITFVDNNIDIDKTNLELCRRALMFLGIPCNNLRLSRLFGRQTYIGGIMFDGGHNVAAAQALAPNLNHEAALIGMMADKDVEGYLKIVAPKCKSIVAVTPSNPRALDSKELCRIASEYCSNVIAIDDIKQHRKYGPYSLICGSFYLLRDFVNFVE